jgi:tetratricopeptide (TPR) repeat protein
VKNPLLVIRLLPLAIAAALISQAAAQAPAESPARQAEAFYRQGLAAEEAGDPAAARLAYQQALKANSRHANAEYSLGQLKINFNSIAAKGREAKFGTVLVPEIKFDQATLKESLDALQNIVEKQSKDAVTPNFIIQDPKNSLAKASITLVLKNTPARAVLQYLLDQAGAKARYDEHAIVITSR